MANWVKLILVASVSALLTLGITLMTVGARVNIPGSMVPDAYTVVLVEIIVVVLFMAGKGYTELGLWVADKQRSLSTIAILGIWCGIVSAACIYLLASMVTER